MYLSKKYYSEDKKVFTKKLYETYFLPSIISEANKPPVLAYYSVLLAGICLYWLGLVGMG